MANINPTSAEESKNTTQSLTLNDFSPGMMKLESYSLPDLSGVLITHLSRTNLTNIQDRGLNRYRYQGTWNWGQPINMADFKKLFDIFNDVYFNGVLTGYCTIGICKEMDFPKDRVCEPYLSRRPRRTYSYVLRKGVCRDTRYKREKTTAYIMIQERNDLQKHGSLGCTMNSFAKEMLRVYFLLFACECKLGCSHRLRALDELGGRNWHWQAAADAFEKASTRPDLMEFFVFLDGYSDAADIIYNGGKLADSSTLTQRELEYGFSVDEFLVSINSLVDSMVKRDMEKESPEKLKSFMKGNACIRAESL